MSEYDYQRYFRAIRSTPELTPRAGMSWAEIENWREQKRHAEELEQREIIYNDRSGDIYPNLQRAWEDADRIESGFGQSDCRKGKNYDRW